MTHYATVIKSDDGWGWPRTDRCPEPLVWIVSNLDQVRENIRRSAGGLPPDSLWTHIAPTTPAAGNLLLHLVGTERHWIHRNVGGLPLVRDRAEEFSTTGGRSLDELLADLDDAARLTHEVVGRLVDIGQTITPTIQFCFHYTAQHFAYHSGQIVTIRKMFQPEFQVYPAGP